jgi:hypothetical protein
VSWDFRILALLVAGVTSLGPGVGIASAHTTRFNSTVTIEHDGSVFSGTVSSPRSGCVPNRLVKLYSKDEGPDTFLGSDRTDQNGEWEETAPFSAGLTYYAKVTRRDIGSAGHDHICRADRSPNLTLEP